MYDVDGKIESLLLLLLACFVSPSPEYTYIMYYVEIKILNERNDSLKGSVSGGKDGSEKVYLGHLFLCLGILGWHNSGGFDL